MFDTIVKFFESFGPWGLFIHAFFDAIIFPIPAFFLQVSLSILNPTTALWLATVGYIACLLGTPIGYMLGKLMGKSVLYRFLKTEWIDAATSQFQKNGEAAILIGSFTPIPFKVFTILSGCLNFPLWRLMAYAALGRGLKFYIVGALFYFYGRAAENMVGDVTLYIFLIGVPLIVAFLLLRKRRMKKKALAKQAEDAAKLQADPALVANAASDASIKASEEQPSGKGAASVHPAEGVNNTISTN